MQAQRLKDTMDTDIKQESTEETDSAEFDEKDESKSTENKTQEEFAVFGLRDNEVRIIPSLWVSPSPYLSRVALS